MFATSTRLWNEVIKQCYVYGLAPCLQLLWFCLSDERKSKFVLMKPESRYCWFRGMHKLQLDNARCFTASCRGVITVVSRMRVLEGGGRGGGRPLFCRRPPPPGHSQSVIKKQVTVHSACLSWQRALNWWSCPTELINQSVHHQYNRQLSSHNPSLNKWRGAWYKTYIGLHLLGISIIHRHKLYGLFLIAESGCRSLSFHRRRGRLKWVSWSLISAEFT